MEMEITVLFTRTCLCPYHLQIPWHLCALVKLNISIKCSKCCLSRTRLTVTEELVGSLGLLVGWPVGSTGRTSPSLIASRTSFQLMNWKGTTCTVANDVSYNQLVSKNSLPLKKYFLFIRQEVEKWLKIFTSDRSARHSLYPLETVSARFCLQFKSVNSSHLSLSWSRYGSLDV